MRGPFRSRKKAQLIRPITAGMLAKITPADTALVMLTPYNMQIDNRKLPKGDSMKTSHLTCGVNGGSCAGARSQGDMASAAMPKRSQASRNTGNTATSGLDKAT